VLPSYIPLLECSWKVHLMGIGALTGIVAATLETVRACHLQWYHNVTVECNIRLEMIVFVIYNECVVVPN
jgi:hypothetical protein